MGSPSIAVAVLGQPFGYQIVASGQPTSFSASGLPPGFTLDAATGLITGPAKGATPGVYTVTLTATNGEGTSSNYSLTITVGSPPVITSAASISGAVGQAFSFQIEAANEPTSFRASNLPPGLTLDVFSGVISGTPTLTGSYEVPLRALNAAGGDSATLSITIASGPPPANDNFADAQNINGLLEASPGTNVQATRETGEPNHFGGLSANASVWYAWTAPSTRNYRFDTSWEQLYNTARRLSRFGCP